MLALAVFLVETTVVSTPGVACAAPVMEAARDANDRPAVPDYIASPDAFELPTVPDPDVGAPLSSGPSVFVRHIRVTGNTAFTDAEIHSIVAPYENRLVTSEELAALRVALTRHYVDHGYINSGALLPDQAVADGEIEMRIVEGRISEIKITGRRFLREAYLRSRIARQIDSPLNMSALQESLRILLQDTLVSRINATLQPGGLPGESRLDADIEERRPYLFETRFDNESAPSLGALRINVALGTQSLLGWGDRIVYRHERAEGQTRHFLSYDLPINSRDTAIGAWIDTAESNNVEMPFNTIDIEGRYDAHGLKFEQPLFRTSRYRFSTVLAFERRTSRTYLLGVPFSFAPGVQNGRSEVSVIRISQDWSSRTLDEVLVARSEFHVGIDAFTPTLSANGPDGRFFKWTGQLQYARRWGPGETVLRADLQLTANPLLPIEKMALGGATTVRGYRENQIVRDQGFVTSAEYRVPAWDNRRYRIHVELAGFFDMGGAWEREEHVDGPPVIASVGLGLRAEAANHLAMQLYWGHGLMSVADPGGDLQDDGIHFSLTVGLEPR